MATLTELKTRVILETNRDDMSAGGAMEQALIDAYTRAIEFHADEAFWFNRKTGTVSTVASATNVALPSGMRIAQIISHLQVPLIKAALGDIEHLAATGLPTRWAENEGAIQLSPIPDAAYSLKVTGIAELGVPATTNEWTTEAYDLICARTRLILYRDYLRDGEGASFASLAEAEALTKLRRETRRRGATVRGTDLPVPAGFNIATG